ncbi:hypothetical protein CY34DRAFT_809244 [Suillus luteus UH-Slu-Lm8-n1]|uniref:Uncharacterized protein n=1 Tax=Suillus luteus UH-Slu-Lm8-n1 TaxID=930992 RepID=A0A0C9ZLZ3_9AGAM|nr:hypothetical protein CY34DRAFT_809244 [Suillus luteus UH-Slu-Lm8-n1]
MAELRALKCEGEILGHTRLAEMLLRHENTDSDAAERCVLLKLDFDLVSMYIDLGWSSSNIRQGERTGLMEYSLWHETRHPKQKQN